MKDKLFQLTTSNPSFTRALSSGKYPELFTWVKMQPGTTLMEKIYNTLNDIVEQPKCQECNSTVELVSLSKGYRLFCGQKCQNNHNKKQNFNEAVNKLNTFGNLEYISGYTGSHSKVKVKNLVCGCEFEARYLNLFTNPNYCPVHGRELKIKKIIESNHLEQTKAKRAKTIKERTKIKQEAESDRVKLQNQLIENEVILTNMFKEFIESLKANSKVHTPRLIKEKFPKIVALIDKSKGETFWEKAFNLSNPEFDNACRECRKPTKFNIYNSRLGYREFCSSACANINERIRNKIRDTNTEKYGVAHHLSNEQVMQKRKETNIRLYGVENPLQRKDILDKVMKSQFRLKNFTLPSGKVVKLMGFEPQVVMYLLQNGYVEDDLVFDIIPTIAYDRKHWYFPDIFIPKENLLVEVKSQWTYDVDLEKNTLKAEASVRAGFKHVIIIWDGKFGIKQQIGTIPQNLQMLK